jgi:hypothetical protein
MFNDHNATLLIQTFVNLILNHRLVLKSRETKISENLTKVLKMQLLNKMKEEKCLEIS